MNSEQKIARLKKSGWAVHPLGRNISATKISRGAVVQHRGSVNKVHKAVFGY